jgi:hypothetical protein
MSHPPITPLLIIGWRELVSLPGLKVAKIKAKLDTGARSSSLHAFDVQTFTEGPAEFVRFSIHPIQRHETPQIAAVAPILERRLVRSSNGETDNRIVIRTELSLLGEIFPIDLTLANRDAMGFRMLIGREALRGRFLIDAAQSYLGGRPSKRQRLRLLPDSHSTAIHPSKES